MILRDIFFPGFGLLIQLIVFLVFLSILYWLLKSSNISKDSPKEILKKRLVKGEITKKEFEELLKEIEK